MLVNNFKNIWGNALGSYSDAGSDFSWAGFPMVLYDPLLVEHGTTIRSYVNDKNHSIYSYSKVFDFYICLVFR